MSSVYNAILDAIVRDIQSLGLVDASRVVKRKLPRAQEQLDTLPLLCVVPSERPERVTPLDYDADSVVYATQVALIRANDGDQVGGIDTLAEWREKIRRRFDSPPLDGVREVWDVGTDPEPVFDRSLIPENYDFSVLTILTTAREPR